MDTNIRFVFSGDPSGAIAASNQTTSALQKVGTEAQTSTGKAATAAESFAESVRKISPQIRELGTVMSGLGATAAAAFSLSVRESIKFESAFAGVKKTVNDLSSQALQQLSNQFLRLSETIPVSAAELSRIGELAGQLGVKGQSIIGFTRTIADLSVATDLTSESAATMVAQFGNITRVDQSKFSNIGSAITVLGNNSAATESAILEMALRIAGAGSVAGISAPNILGLATALAGVGINAEAGGTAMSQLIIKMNSAVKSGGDALADFAKVAGVSGKVFQKTFEQDGAKAIGLFIQGIDRLNKSGVDVSGVLDQLGLDGIRMTDAILRSSQATGEFDDTLKLANRSFTENNALTKEAGERYKTSESQLTLLRNTVSNTAKDIGDSLGPSIRSVVESLKPLIKDIGDWVRANPELSASLFKVSAAVGAVMLVVGPLLIALPSLVGGFATLATGAKVVVVALGGIGTTLLIALPAIAAATLAIGGIVVAFLQWRSAVAGWKDANQGLATVTEKLNQQLKDVGKGVDRGTDSWESYTDRVRKAHQENSTLVNKLGIQKIATEKNTAAEIVAAASAAAHTAKLKEQGEAAKKSAAALDELAGTLGVKLTPVMKDFNSNFEKVTVALLASGKSAGELELDLLVMAEAAKKAHEATKTLAQRTEDWLNSADLQHAALMRNVTAIDRMRSATIALADAPDPMISNNATLEAQMHHLGVITEGWGKLQDKIGGTPEIVKPAKQSFEDMGQEVSTIVTDMGKGIADALIKWEGFGKSMIKVAQEFGSGILRTLLKHWFAPMKKLLDDAAGWITGIFGGGGGGKAGATGGAGGLLGSLTGGLASLLGAGAGATGLSGLFGGGVAGKVAGAGVGIVGGGLAGGALGLSGGLAGAGTGGGMAGLTAALGAIPVWGWAALGAAMAAGPVIGMLTQRGRDKTAATGSAEDLSANVWQNIIPDVKAGNLTIQQGIDAVNEAWVKYEAFLRANLKDQTVIQRSLDSQRGTLTQSLAELEAMKAQMGTEGMASLRGFLDEMARTGIVTDEAIAGLKGVVEQMKFAGLEAETSAAKLGLLGAEFFKTGVMTEDFASALTAAGGSADFFTKLTGEVKNLQGLRNELGSLKQMVDSFLPKQKTWMENFVETGEITEEMAAKIRAAGGDIQDFKKFAEMKEVKTQFEGLVEEFGKTGVASDKLLDMIKEFGGADAMKAFEDLRAEANKSGKSIGELAKDSEGSAKTIQDAFESTSTGINKAFGDAAKQLSDTLAKMDENLGKAIASLQSAMVTMIKDLIDVLLGVPGAAEKAAKDANFFLGSIKAPQIRINITTHFDDSGLREAERRAAALGAINPTQGQPDIFNPIDSGGGRSVRSVLEGTTRVPGFASGTDYVPRTGLAMVHQGEAIVPASQNKGTTGSGGDTVLNFYGDIVANNPEELMEQLARRLQTNAGGSRVRIQKALKLKSPGAF